MPPRTGDRDRCVTGIDGLDTILYGGIPRDNTVLLTGSCGTGKTSLALEYLIHGAVAGENSLFISVTEDSEKLLANIIPYKFFDRDLIKSGKLVFVDLPAMYERLGMTKSELTMEEIDLLVAAIGNLVKELGIKRLVMDSITSVCYKLKTPEKIRDFILKMGKILSDLGCTSVLVSEVAATLEASTTRRATSDESARQSSTTPLSARRMASPRRPGRMSTPPCRAASTRASRTVRDRPLSGKSLPPSSSCNRTLSPSKNPTVSAALKARSTLSTNRRSPPQ